MGCISAPTAALVGGGVSGAGSLLGGLFGASAATTAAKQQEKAVQQAITLQQNIAQTIQQQLSPWLSTGGTALGALSNQLGLPGGGGPLLTPYANAPGSMGAFNPLLLGTSGPRQMAARLSQMPGYQFTLGQGLKSTQNAFAAQGLGSSGAALKGAAQYSTGLANTTYNQQLQNYLQSYQTGFSNYLGQNQQIYNMLGGLATSGQAAAANLGQIGTTIGANMGNLITSGGAAGAAGTVGSANALIGGLTGATGSVGNAMMAAAFLPSLMSSSGMYGNFSANQDFTGGGGAYSGPNSFSG